MICTVSSHSLRASAFRNKLYGIIFFMLLLLSLEGAARLMDFFLVRTPGLAVPPHLFRLDSELGWSLRPGASGSSKRTGSHVRYVINSRGLRDKETSCEKPAGVTRVVLLGDSRTFGFGVPVEKHYSTLLEGYLDNVECINMGVDGYGVDQALLYLRKEGFSYQPDIVTILVSHFEDDRHLHDKRWGMGKPLFLLENGGLVLTNMPVSNNADWYVCIRWLDRAASRSRAYVLLRNVICQIVLSRGQSVGKHKTTGQDKPPTRVDMHDGLARRPLYEVALAILSAMDADCAAHGAKLVVLTQMPELHERALEAGLRSVNLFVPMNNPRFALPDGLAHINEAGNGVLAWEVAQYLVREGLVDSRRAQ